MWVIFAIASAFFHACIYLVNERLKVKALHLTFWLRSIAILALLPVIFFLPVPEDPMFYGYTALTALLFCYFDLMAFGLIGKNGAGVVSRVEPLTVGATFII